MKMIGWILVFICICFDVRAQSTSQFFQTHRILFFFASTCPYCHKEAPILKRWVDLQGASVMAYSFDGGSLPDFPETYPLGANLVNAAFQNHAIEYPALFILNVKTNVLYPISIGALDETELNERLQSLLPKVMQYEARSGE